MFFCDRCAEVKRMKKSMFKSRGNCELCCTYADCSDVPSKDIILLDDAPKQESEVKE